jgi:Fe-S-cluster containining protein
MRFACQRGCINCCTQQGFVYLTEQDVARAAEFLGISTKQFERRYVYRTKNLRRLRTPRDVRCHFLAAGGCSIHPAKPTQCRTFPFWPELVESRRAWHKTAAYCPGIGRGKLIQIEAAQLQAGEMRAAHPNLYK